MTTLLNRRNFLRATASAVAGWTAGLPSPSFAERPNWKTAIGLNGFASGTSKYGATYPIWEVLAFASKTGFDGIELVENWPMGGYPASVEQERIGALRRLYEAFGLQVFSIQMGAGGAFHSDTKVRGEWLETFRDCARLAKALGCSHVGMWPGGPLGDQTLDQATDRLVESFRAAGDVAGELGLVAAFEIEPPFVFNTESRLAQILDRTDHPNLKTIYDPSHFDLMTGSTGKPHEMLLRIGVNRIGYVHLTDTDGTLRDGGTSKHLPCGDGHANIPTSLAVLRQQRFAGWIMIDAWEIPDVHDAGRKGYQMIRNAMEEE